ncbi:TolC family protein [Foetidibacter luteolus]|uniref:TolC family protein n=1 Tax=Foetidibacter luteolus TaxID=2608880 RepID=UPI00129AE4D0|nr:TolC family protein [Foetidibacter luteolus]
MKKLTYIVLFLAALQQTRAQVQANSELKGLVNQSFSYFPKIKEVQNTVETAKERLDIAQTKLPTVDANVSYNYVRPKITLPLEIDGKTEEFQFAPVHNGNANVGVDYLLFDFGRLKANVDKAKTEIKYAEHNVEYVKNQLAYQVATIYYNIIYLQKAIAIQDTVLNFLNENKRITESKLRNGDAIKIDLLNIQSQVDIENNRKVDLQNSLQKQINLLEYSTGVKTSNGTSFDFDIPLKDVYDGLSEAQKNNLDYVLAKDKIKQALGDVAIAKTSDKPSLGIGADAGVKNGYVPNVNQMRFNYAAGVTLKVPLFDGGKAKRQVKLAETVVKQNELAVETLNSTYKRDIEQALTDIQSNMERIKNTAGQIEQARAAETITASRYKNGVATNLEVTSTSTNVQKVLLTRLQYDYQLCLAKVELSRLLGYQYW